MTRDGTACTDDVTHRDFWPAHMVSDGYWRDMRADYRASQLDPWFYGCQCIGDAAAGDLLH